MTMPGKIVAGRRILAGLVAGDLRRRYLGSALGAAWALIQPAAFVAAIWFVFAVGLRRGGRVEGVPYLLFLLPGMALWIYVSAALSGSEEAIVHNRNLVLRMVFPVELLPPVRVLSSLAVHLLLLLLVAGLYLAHGRPPLLHWLQLPYYLAATVSLLWGIALLSAAVFPFFRDVSQVMQIGLRAGLWFTPVFWSIRGVPRGLRLPLQANPLYYVVTGYRESLLGTSWFWERGLATAYFWAFVLGLLLLGGAVFRRLRPHFPEVV